MDNSNYKHIYCKVSTNEDNNSFIGVRIRNNNVEFCYPESYDISGLDGDGKNILDIKLLRRDIVDILHTISLAKTRASASQLTENGVSYTENFALISYLWVIKDYFGNGFYRNKEKLYKSNAKGKVNWKKTIDTQPIISQGNVIYNKVIVEIKNDCDTIITEAHKFCVYDSVRKMGWLFGINEKAFRVSTPTKSMLKLYVNSIKQEMAKTFDDIKKLRLSHMLKVLSGVDDSKYISEIVYGVDTYHYVYERMVDAIFGNVTNIKKYNPNADWNIMVTDSTLKSKAAPSLRLDTLRIESESYIRLIDSENRIGYILDAKFYRFGSTGIIDDLPETTSIQKQVTYGDNMLNNFAKEDNITEVHSAFILPYNKKKHPFKFKDEKDLVYIGFANAKWRKEEQECGSYKEHEVIHAFLLDTKHLVSSWSRGNCRADIDKLISDIEEYQERHNNWVIVKDEG